MTLEVFSKYFDAESSLERCPGCGGVVLSVVLVLGTPWLGKGGWNHLYLLFFEFNSFEIVSYSFDFPLPQEGFFRFRNAYVSLHCFHSFLRYNGFLLPACSSSSAILKGFATLTDISGRLWYVGSHIKFRSEPYESAIPTIRVGKYTSP